MKWKISLNLLDFLWVLVHRSIHLSLARPLAQENLYRTQKKCKEINSLISITNNWKVKLTDRTGCSSQSLMTYNNLNIDKPDFEGVSFESIFKFHLFGHTFVSLLSIFTIDSIFASLASGPDFTRSTWEYAKCWFQSWQTD